MSPGPSSFGRPSQIPGTRHRRRRSGHPHQRTLSAVHHPCRRLDSFPPRHLDWLNMLVPSLSVWKKVILVEGLVPATVPDVEHEIPEELDISCLDCDGRFQFARVFGDMIMKDDAAHGGLAGATFSHKQYLLLLRLLLELFHSFML